MPRPMLKPAASETKSQNTILSATPDQKQKKQVQQIDKMKLDRLLRKPRSKKYMDAMHQLDAGGHVQNQNKVNEIIDAIRSEFPEVEIAGILIGIVSECYLGKPYEVHTLNMASQIIEHYVQGHPLPYGMDKARSIALRGGYDFIEVYTDCCRAVDYNGNVSVISM